MLFRMREGWDDIHTHVVQYGLRRLRVTGKSSSHFTRFHRVSFLIAEGLVGGLARVRTVRHSGDFDVEYELDDVRIFAQRVHWQSVFEAMPEGKRSNLLSALSARSALAPGTRDLFIGELEKFEPQLRELIDELSRNRTEDALPDDIRHNVFEQRDAIALGLEMAGIDSREALNERGVGMQSERFISSIKRVHSASEASILRHDAENMPDWLPSGSEFFDVWNYVDPEDSGRRVSVFYADKEPLERLTGTDLIYYRHELNAFVLVQYKRLAPSSPDRRPSYRPDDQLRIEIERMKALDLAPSKAKSLADFRLSQEPFYFKLVDPESTRPEANRLSTGLYYPLEAFELLLIESSSQGPRGGTYIDRANARRYLSNTEFVSLVQQGWIGTATAASANLVRIVAEKLDASHGLVVVVDESREAGARPIRRR